ncbi:MAG: hypothetical protein HY319_00850 [Armatimonadetes bacterium]|nr:hypothetical protein [Armatimonadota bacterium]
MLIPGMAKGRDSQGHHLHGGRRGFQALLRAIGLAADITRQRSPNGNAAEEDDVSIQLDVRGGEGFLDSDDQLLENGNVLRQFGNGNVRLENPTSGVLQEEGADGSLWVSLPTGQVIQQQAPGEPLLVYETHYSAPPRLARVGYAVLPGSADRSAVYHFHDPEAEHVIELESLRYFRLRRA